MVQNPDSHLFRSKSKFQIQPRRSESSSIRRLMADSFLMWSNQASQQSEASKEERRAAKRAGRDAKTGIAANPANGQNAGVVPGSRGNATEGESRKGKEAC